MREIKMPLFMREAGETGGHSASGELVIFVLLYLGGIIVEAFGMVPGMLTYFMQDPEALSMFRTGKMNTDILSRLMQDEPEWLVIYALCAEILLVAVYLVYCRFIEKRKFRTMGFCREGIVPMYGRGLLIGAVMFCSAYLLCVVTGSVRVGGLASDLVPAYLVMYFLGYMIQGMAEEVICRGYFMVSVSRRYSVQYSAVLSSFVFMALHYFNEQITLLGMINLFLFGMFMALLFVESGNIWIVAAVHTVWNFLQGNIFGISVSGLAKQNSVLETVFMEDRTMMNGGGFGIEGGFAVTLVLATSIYVVSRMMEKKGMFLVRQGQGEETQAGDIPGQQGREDLDQREEDRAAGVGDMHDRRNGQEKAPVPDATGEKTLSDVGEVSQTVFNASYFSEGTGRDKDQEG